MMRAFRFAVLAFLMVGAVVNCGKEDRANAPLPPGQCIPGQPCNLPPPPPCPPGSACGNANAVRANTYAGNLYDINKDRAKKIGQALGGYCWGFGYPANPCSDYTSGYIYIEVYPGAGTSTHRVIINLGADPYHQGINLAGIATAYQINNGRGTQLKFKVNYTGWEMNIVSNSARLDGTVADIPDVQVLYNPDRPFARASLTSNRY